ncbi:MAG: agmatine deiminase family protein [Phycisphaerae bacterium]
MTEPQKTMRQSATMDLALLHRNGFRMPAEWEPHAATWLAWPHNKEDWPGKFAPIPWIIADIIRHIAAAETVHLLVQSAGHISTVRDILDRAGVKLSAVRFHVLKTDRIWTRDSGPIFVKKIGGGPGDMVVLGWLFNAWAKYDNYHRDARLPAYVATTLDLKLLNPMAAGRDGKTVRIVLEGGSIDVNGAGCLLTTEECLLSKVQCRNPGLSRAVLEEKLCAYLGVQKILWLRSGIVGDDTHGHIDDTARFISASAITLCVEPNIRDANHRRMLENIRRIKAMRDTRGRGFDVIELPLPKPVYFEKQRLPASYANFYICNGGVLVPVFNDPADVRALKILEQCFPDRRIIPIYCRDLVWGLGTLHCMTQQQPR